MVRMIILLLLAISPIFSTEKALPKETKKRIQKEAKELGKIALKEAFQSFENTISTDDLLPSKDKGKEFDSSAAKRDTLSGNINANPVFEFLKENPATDQFNSENEMVLSENQYEPDSQGDYIEICTESSDPVLFDLTRTLNYQPEKIIKEISIRKCQGHKEIKKVKVGEGKKKASKKNEEFESDLQIKSFNVSYVPNGSKHHDLVISKWNHIDDCPSCDNNKSLIEYQDDGVWKIANEKWEYSDPSLEELASSPNSTLISKSCLDSSARSINGTTISRCWVEKYQFKYVPKKVAGCEYLKSQFCKLKASECLKNGPFGCELWKRSFNCYKKLDRKNTYELSAEEFGLEDPIWEIAYEPNKNLSDVVTKLEIFKAMDKELQESEVVDFKNYEFFSGKKWGCYEHRLENLVCDCCNKMGGIAIDALLVKCTEEEKALHQLKSRGQCHDIGTREKEVLGVRISEEHVYCCFSSKLSRVFVEESKEQLGIDWGDAKHPDCKGLTQAQIQKINFDKINLSEAFDSPTVDLNSRLGRLQQKIKDGLKKEEKN